MARSKKEVRHRHPAANRKAGERLRGKLLAANEADAAVHSGEKAPEETP